MLYSIGDSHGRLDLVTKLYQAILDDIEKVKDPLGSIIIWLGDYIDRGPDSKGVLDFLMALQDFKDVKYIFLLGNHEAMMMDGCKYPEGGDYYLWMNNGGAQTLKSFGLSTPYEKSKMVDLLKPYVEWIEKLPFYYTAYDYIFSHSGYIRTDFPIPLDAQRQSLIWGRPFGGMYKNYDKLLIHGHSPLNGKPHVEKNRINIDVGGWYIPGNLNTLCSVVLPHGDHTEIDARFIQIYLNK